MSSDVDAYLEHLSPMEIKDYFEAMDYLAIDSADLDPKLSKYYSAYRAAKAATHE